MTIIVRPGQRSEDDLDDLRARAAELEARLDERAAEIARVQLQVSAFTIHYRQEVGLLHEELDELEAAIAEVELGELSKQIGPDARPTGKPESDPNPDAGPRFTSDAVRKLFRDVAKAIHPDLARDDHTRSHRHRLMVEANRAYSLGDEDRLRWILESWHKGPEAVPDNGPDSVRLRLQRRIAQVEEQLIELDGELSTLKASPMWTLKVMVDEATSRGRNLVEEMVGRLKRDIMVARNRLDAIKWSP
ncbi:MAG: hypothetical protein AB7I50_07705 [Vicinamibacterales bacterium]